MRQSNVSETGTVCAQLVPRASANSRQGTRPLSRSDSEPSQGANQRLKAADGGAVVVVRCTITARRRAIAAQKAAPQRSRWARSDRDGSAAASCQGESAAMTTNPHAGSEHNSSHQLEGGRATSAQHMACDDIRNRSRNKLQTGRPTRAAQAGHCVRVDISAARASRRSGARASTGAE